ncbi:MAG TPA: hypothetical protein VK525_21105 [Candidatus Saccharimonadales bacterium]|nr:hypothetical protein [Candidatus Saccharimonadales bacterium]
MSVCCRLFSALSTLAFLLVFSAPAFSRPAGFFAARYSGNRQSVCERVPTFGRSDSSFLENSDAPFRPANGCDWQEFAHNRDHWYRHAARSPVETNGSDDPVQSELGSEGTAGATIARARQTVLRILEEKNSCSAWMQQKVADPAGVFRRVHYKIDLNGEKYALKLQSKDDTWYFQDPYAASVIQDGDPPVWVTLNAAGAFFKSGATMRSFYKDGTVAGVLFAKRLNIEIYLGGSLRAQVIILLHELAHVLDAIPADSLTKGDIRLSDRNTETVLHFCRVQVESANR